MRTKEIAEFGDFQTPYELAQRIAHLLRALHVSPAAVVEPSCGIGNFLKASIDTFESEVKYFGFDVNPQHVRAARALLASKNGVVCEIWREDFFEKDWKSFFGLLPDNVLVIGNPPWVTNSALGCLGSENLPEKNNFQRHLGFAAKTGKANFDISEWLLIRLLESLNRKKACIAMLCKTATARKVLTHAWKNSLDVSGSSLHLIDANKYFRASVDACLFVTRTGTGRMDTTAQTFGDLDFNRVLYRFGWIDGELVADLDTYESLKDIEGLEYRKWRSGVKHDAVDVMEFTSDGEFYINGLGERRKLEPAYIYPLLKSSDLANGRLVPRRFVLVTQRRVSDDTSVIKQRAPRTWQYLLDHAQRLDRRKSIIYEKRPRFSVFGVGDYTFAPWKVAISGLYSNMSFEVIGNLAGKPTVVDDTCYFIPCQSQGESVFFAALLNSEIARRFIRALAFFDAKRPINIDLLKRIDLRKLAERLHLGDEARLYLESAVFEHGAQKVLVFDKKGRFRHP